MTKDSTPPPAPPRIFGEGFIIKSKDLTAGSIIKAKDHVKGSHQKTTHTPPETPTSPQNPKTPYTLRDQEEYN